MNGATTGISQGTSDYDVIGASEGPDIGTLAPDSQSFLLRALAAHLDKISAVVLSNPQAPTEQVEYEVDNANIPAGGLQYKLPSGLPIISYHIENLSASRLSVFAGPSAGRALNTIAGAYYKVGLMPQAITSLTITTAGGTTGIVRVVLTSAVLSPVQGSAS